MTKASVLVFIFLLICEFERKMLTELLYMNLIIAGILLLTGFYFQKKAFYLSLSGAAILIITGIVFYSQGVDVLSGATETVTGNVTSIINNRITVQDDTTAISSFVIILLGFAGAVGSVMGLARPSLDADEKQDDYDDYQ